MSRNSQLQNSQLQHLQTKKRFLTKISEKRNPFQNHIKKCSRMILVMTLQHACNGNLQHLKFLSLAAHHCHQWARIQLILNQRIISASGVSIKKPDQIQRHLFKSNGFSKFDRKTTGTPLTFDLTMSVPNPVPRCLNQLSSTSRINSKYNSK